MSDFTDKQLFLNRRQLVKQAVALGLLPKAGWAFSKEHTQEEENKVLKVSSKTHVSQYNNYYEFSTNKEAVAHLSQALTLSPWSLDIYHNNTLLRTLTLEDLKAFPQHERIYRLRCVEGWSAVIPWRGVQLSDVLQSLDASANAQKAKYVKFEALHRPSEMLGQRRGVFPWPYTEGLRMDEAMHPLTLLATGMYEGDLLPQCGAPLRLVVPWKYGFKSLKALTRITLTDEQPVSSWSRISPGEYGFYANVNPEVPHPRWSQRRELPLGEIRKIATLPFNGYADEVANLYKDMDLSQYY